METWATPWANPPRESSSAGRTQPWMAPRAAQPEPCASCDSTPRKTRSAVRLWLRPAEVSTSAGCPLASRTLGPLPGGLDGFRDGRRCLHRWPRAYGLAHAFAAEAAHYLYQSSGTRPKSQCVCVCVCVCSCARYKPQVPYQRQTCASTSYQYHNPARKECTKEQLPTRLVHAHFWIRSLG